MKLNNSLGSTIWRKAKKCFPNKIPTGVRPLDSSVLIVIAWSEPAACHHIPNNPLISIWSLWHSVRDTCPAVQLLVSTGIWDLRSRIWYQNLEWGVGSACYHILCNSWFWVSEVPTGAQLFCCSSRIWDLRSGSGMESSVPPYSPTSPISWSEDRWAPVTILLVFALSKQSCEMSC